jgi:ligand-binding sensor domain-containing protein
MSTFDPHRNRLAGRKSRGARQTGGAAQVFWAMVAAVVALFAVIWLASGSESGSPSEQAANDGGRAHKRQPAEHLVKPAARMTAAGNVRSRSGPGRFSQPALPTPVQSGPAPVATQPASGAQTSESQSAASIAPPQPLLPKSDSKPSPTVPSLLASSSSAGGYKPPAHSSGKPARLPAGAFVVSLAQDHAGQVWVGTEDLGVFRYDPTAAENAQWTEFTKRDGLGDDNAYALCVDRLNRVWVGHLNHGVSVYNGQSWQNYDVLEGPIGERAFSIAADRATGDVWIATSAGLTQYSLELDTWTHYTRDDGLPSDQIQSLAFDSRGTLYAGTQCDGLAISSVVRGRRRWLQITGSDTPPLGPSGPGLPSNLINDVLVSRDGTVFVATTCGVCASKDHGKSWAFLRGADWAAKVKGLQGGAPRGWRESRAPLLLTEDYCTRLAEDDSGLLWIGHRQTGYEAIDPAILQRRFDSRTEKKSDKKSKEGESDLPDYVLALLSVPGHNPLVGWYGNGLTTDIVAGRPTANTRSTAGTISPARHPTPAAAPGLDEFNTLLAKLAAVPTPKQLAPTVVRLPDDWRTQGDWLGRYGRYWACLCAICAPQNYIWGAGPEEALYSAKIGPNHPGTDDQLRHWVHWLYTSDRRSLEMPPTYFDSRVVKGLTTPDKNRRQAEWDDHGETYPQSLDGPDIYCTLEIPAGQFYLSLYDFNKDGHDAGNRFRDYRISIRPHAQNLRLDRCDDFSRQPELANGRIHDFWGGVWTRYYVQGPMQLTIQARRSGSMNAILAGIMLDFVDEQPVPYFCTLDEWHARMAGLAETRKAILSEPTASRADRFRPASDAAVAAERLCHELEQMRLRNTALWASQSRPYYSALARWFQTRSVTGSGGGARIATCYYQVRLFERWEEEQRAGGLCPARDIEKALRWDEASYIDQGRGFKIVSKYIAQSKQNKRGAPEPSAP